MSLGAAQVTFRALTQARLCHTVMERRSFAPIVLHGWRNVLAMVGYASWPVGWVLVGGHAGNLIAGIGSVLLLVAWGSELVARHRSPPTVS